MATDVAQRERNNIKCYAMLHLLVLYIYIYIYIYIDAKPLNMCSRVVSKGSLHFSSIFSK